MANFATFSYGTGQTYGTAGAILSATLVRQNRLLINYNARVLVEDAVLDVNNYLISDPSNPTVSVVPVYKVVPFLNGFRPGEDRNDQYSAPTYTDFFELVTGYHSMGEDYRITAAVNSSFSIVGPGFVGTTFQEYIGRRSKTDFIVDNVQDTLDTRSGSVANAVLMAIGMEDDRIGGGYVTPPSVLEVNNSGTII